MKIDLEQIKDCDHCFHTFGSLGCCDTVNNEWVYSCREGQKEYLIYRVLEIIDKWEKHLSNYTDGIYVQGQKMMLTHIRCDVSILKGEQG